MKSYRVLSFIVGWLYLGTSLSLQVRPPGEFQTARNRGSGARVSLPEHQTFFQQVHGGPALWLALFALGGLVLIGTSTIFPHKTPLGHAVLMVVTAAFGVGYVVSSLQLEQGWLVGGFVLILTAMHALALRARPNVVDFGDDYRDAE